MKTALTLTLALVASMATVFATQTGRRAVYHIGEQAKLLRFPFAAHNEHNANNTDDEQVQARAQEQPQAQEQSSEKLTEQSTEQLTEQFDSTKTLRFAAWSGVRQIVVDNVHGSVDVSGYDGQDVQLVVRKSIRAENADALQRAKTQTWLGIRDGRDTIEIFTESPEMNYDGRSRPRWTRDRWDWGNWQRKQYSVQYDITLKVPRASNCALRTVNRGSMRLNDVDGFFNVENVNGGIEMKNIGGSGRAYAVNGAVLVMFSKNPTNQCYIGSLNGAVTAMLPNNLSADFRFKTFNGNAYTNFDVTPITLTPKVEDVSSNGSSKKGKYVYRNKGEYGVRVGTGGVELSFDAFNGTINVLKREK